MQALVFPVGTEWLAVPSACVREVVAAPEVVSLPTAPPTVLGVCNRRGEIVSVFDLAALLGTGRTADARFAAVVETPLGAAGLAAAAEPGLVELGERASAAERPGTAGSYRWDERTVVMLDVEALLAPARIGGAT